MNNTIASDHISFEEMSEYIFTDKRPDNFVAIAAHVNSHVMLCPDCKAVYNALMSLKDEIDKIEPHESLSEKMKTRILGFLYGIDCSRPIASLIDECLGFKMWLSFTVKSMKELTQSTWIGFSHPKLATVMKSSTDIHDVEVTESEIKSSLYDHKKNRVSIGLDGTLSLYFDSAEHSVGKRIIIPDDTDVNP